MYKDEKRKKLETRDERREKFRETTSIASVEILEDHAEFFKITHQSNWLCIHTISQWIHIAVMKRTTKKLYLK